MARNLAISMKTFSPMFRTIAQLGRELVDCETAVMQFAQVSYARCDIASANS